MAKLLSETVRGLAEAARRFPPLRAGKSVSPLTMARWISAGIGLPDGSRLRLEGVKVGQAWLTSDEAIERFIVARTNAALGLGEAAAAPARGHGAATERNLDAILGPVGVA